MPPTTTCSALFTRQTPMARFITAMAAAFPSSPWAAWPRWEAKAEPTGAPPTATTCPLTRSSTTSAIKDSGSSPSTSSPVGKAVKESFADVLTNIDCDFNFYLRQVLQEDLREATLHRICWMWYAAKLVNIVLIFWTINVLNSSCIFSKTHLFAATFSSAMQRRLE